MCSKAIFLLLLAALARTATAALDLTPIPADLTEDGVTSHQVTLKSDDGMVAFAPPSGWSCRGQKNRLQLAPPGANFAEGVVEALPIAGPAPLDAAAIAAFKEQVASSLPPGSQGVTTIYEAENTTMPGGNDSFEVVLAYQLWGKTFQRSALLVNGPKDRLIFRFTALKEEFGTLVTVFRRSIMSWRVTPAKADAPAEAQPSEPALK